MAVPGTYLLCPCLRPRPVIGEMAGHCGSGQVRQLGTGTGQEAEGLGRQKAAPGGPGWSAGSGGVQDPAMQLAPQVGLEACGLVVLDGWTDSHMLPFQNAGHQRRFWQFLTDGHQSHNRGPLHRLKQEPSRQSGPSLLPRWRDGTRLRAVGEHLGARTCTCSHPHREARHSQLGSGTSRVPSQAP